MSQNLGPLGEDRAYLLGIIIGGGRVQNHQLTIVFPFKSWGNFAVDPANAGRISGDIVRGLMPLFRNIFQTPIDFRPLDNGNWQVTVENPQNITTFMHTLNIPFANRIITRAQITDLLPQLNGEEKKNFVAGLADTIGSVKESHRRFTDEYQIISFEIPGRNYTLVRDICRILHDLGCATDQILWEHPNFHSGHNPVYHKWKHKGNKLRVLTQEFLENLSFAFTSKARYAGQNLEDRGGELPAQVLCPDHLQDPLRPKEKSWHTDEADETIPAGIRGNHIFHYNHMCCLLDCPHAPRAKLTQFMRENNMGSFFSYFPLTIRGTLVQIENYCTNSILQGETYVEYPATLRELLSLHQNGQNYQSPNHRTVYPINYVIEGIIYLLEIAQKVLSGDQTRIKGKLDLANSRVKLPPNQMLDLQNHLDFAITIRVPGHRTPIILQSGSHGAMVGPDLPDLYGTLLDANPATLQLHYRSLSLEDFNM